MGYGNWLKPAFLAAALLAGPVHALDLDNMSAAERTAFGAQVRAYLLENPQVLREVIVALEAQETAQQASNDLHLVQAYAQALFDDGYSWVGGNPDGDVTLVEFVDYRCTYCRKAHDEVAQLISSDGNIRLIVKEFPILGEQSTLSSRFAIAVKQLAGDDAYKAAHDALITFRGNVTDASLRNLANRLGLDGTEVLARMYGEEVTSVVRANHALGQQMSINGTPTFVMNTRMLRGYVPLDGMRQLVDEARSEG